ncbi:MAG: hypothetical protein ACI4MA_02720 [Treponema sp.]|mgnify:FL=1
MEKKYYTVAEFAEKIGVSRQAVYKSIDKKLNSYVKEVDGKKYIDKSALSVFDYKVVDSTFEKCLSQLEEKDCQIAKILEQLKVKDEQLVRKDEQIEKLQEQISELTKAFREAQALHAGTMQRELSDVSTANDKHRWWKFWQKSN